MLRLSCNGSLERRGEGPRGRGAYGIGPRCTFFGEKPQARIHLKEEVLNVPLIEIGRGAGVVESTAVSKLLRNPASSPYGLYALQYASKIDAFWIKFCVHIG